MNRNKWPVILQFPRKKGREAHAEKDANAIQKKLFFFMAATEFITIILSFAEGIDKIRQAINANYYLLLSIIWIFSLVFLYNSTFKVKKTKWWLFIIVCFVYIASITYKYWEVNIRKTTPSEHPLIRLGFLFPLFILITTGDPTFSTSPPGNSPFKIEEFYLNQELCSYNEIYDINFFSGNTKEKKGIKTFSLDTDVKIAFSRGECIGNDGGRALEKVLPLLQEKVKKQGKPDLLEYIKTAKDLSRVIAERGDLFKQIMFSEVELAEMKKERPAAYRIVQEWLVKCIGIYEPVFTFVLKNITRNKITISKIEFEVFKVGFIEGGETGPLYPIFTYNHFLEFKKGIQSQILHPPIAINGLDNTAFNIRIIPVSKEIGQAFSMRMKIIDSEGHQQNTETFQLVLSK